MEKFFKRAAISTMTILASFAFLLAPLGAAPVSADGGGATYNYVLGTGPLCELEETACPDIAKAPNGDTVEITGEGTLSIHPKTVTGGGTFVHKDPNGHERAHGTWTATKLLTFVGYGCGGGEFPPNFCGGKAQIQVHLTPANGGPGFDGELWVHCLIGNPPAGAKEGVRLSVPGVINFNKEVSGDTLFTTAS